MDMSRVSVWSGALIERPPEEAMEIIAGIGYKKIDLLEKLPHLSLFADECDPAALKAAAEGHGLEIANLATYPGGGLDGRKKAWSAHDWQVPDPQRFTSCGFSSDDPAELGRELEQLCRAIDLAVFFGSRSIRVVAGDDDPKKIDKIASWFQRGAGYAAERGIWMAFENHNANAYLGLGTERVGIAGQPELCMELVEEVRSPYFGILYEPHNLMAEALFDYRAALEIMKDYVVHCHFKDGAPTGDGYGLTPMGEGEIDFPWIVEQLDAVGYDGDFTLEYEIHEDPEAGLKQSYEAFAAMG